MPAREQSSVDHLWVWLSYLMVFGGWAFVALLTVRSHWTPTTVGWVTVAIGSVLGAFAAGRQSRRQRLNEPVVAAVLVAATLIGMAGFTETGAHHGGYPLVGVAFVAALVGAITAHVLPGRGGPVTAVRGIALSTLVCCGSWVVMFFALENWDHSIGTLTGPLMALGIIATIFGCGAMAQFAMPMASRRLVASGGFCCPMLFLTIGLIINSGRSTTKDGDVIGAVLGVTFFAFLSYGCAWAGAALANRRLDRERSEQVTLAPAKVRDANA